MLDSTMNSNVSTHSPNAAAPVLLRGLLYKASPEDFVVEELPQYEPAGAGTHTWLWLEKRGVTTHAAARTLAVKLGKNPLDAGIAGLKDAQAVTRQWISFENAPLEDADCERLSDDKIRVLKITRHGNKLRMGHLRGNRFVIRLRRANSECEAQPVDVAAILRRLDELQRGGIPNYFGEQRFGSGGDNPALGKMLVLGDVPAYRRALAAQGHARRADDRKLRNLIVNAFQSQLFNAVLSARMPDIGTLLPGDLASLHRNGAVFPVLDQATARLEQPRADAHELSPSGPIFGPKMPRPSGIPGDIEARILIESGVGIDDFGRREAGTQPGARRPLRVFFLEAPRAVKSADPTAAADLSFALPSGSYATVVLGELGVGL